jgi:valyl-tRNA synthetase
LPSRKGIYAKKAREKALNRKKSTLITILIILRKIIPIITENIICNITLKSNCTLVPQARHVLENQKGENNVNNSHNLSTLFLQLGHSKPFI